MCVLIIPIVPKISKVDKDEFWIQKTGKVGKQEE
jgi:hypothetical protein